MRGRTLGSDYEKGAIDDEHERHQEQQREPDYADGFKVNWDAIEQHTEQLKQRRIERAQKTKQANRKYLAEIEESQKTREKEQEAITSKLKETTKDFRDNSIKTHNDL
ncbi:DUF334 domain-containing protein [Staphylococcus epidermidis]|nr:DUF334 domain-containing protein [Staphylococcus epidermidis]